MQYVYRLKATGLDGLTEAFPRMIHTSTCFATRALAESQIAAFRQAIYENHIMRGTVTITIEEFEVDAFTRAYVEAALWSSVDDSGISLDVNYNSSNIEPESLAKMIADCATFQGAHWDDIAHNLRRAGRDFWLTRNYHGGGFWDGDWPEAGERLTAASHKYGEVDLYEHKGMLYI